MNTHNDTLNRVVECLNLIEQEIQHVKPDIAQAVFYDLLGIQNFLLGHRYSNLIMLAAFLNETQEQAEDIP